MLFSFCFVSLASAATKTQQFFTIRNVQVGYTDITPAYYNRIIIALQGPRVTPNQMADTLLLATRKGGCQGRSRIIVIGFRNKPSDLLSLPLVGGLKLKEIMDGFVNYFGSNRNNQIVIVGYAMAGSAIQKYSLVHNIRNPNVRFVIGCSSSYTFVDRRYNYPYGTFNLPAKFNAYSINQKVRGNTYLVACGVQDTGSIDNSRGVQFQGTGRISRARNLNRHFQNLGIRSNIVEVQGVGHDSNAVISARRVSAYICNSQVSLTQPFYPSSNSPSYSQPYTEPPSYNQPYNEDNEDLDYE